MVESDEQCWIPSDGSPGVAYLTFDPVTGTAPVTRECLAMLLGRAGFVRVDTP